MTTEKKPNDAPHQLLNVLRLDTNDLVQRRLVALLYMYRAPNYREVQRSEIPREPRIARMAGKREGGKENGIISEIIVEYEKHVTKGAREGQITRGTY